MGMAMGIWRSMRPKQWLKNTFVFAVILFSHKLADLHAIAWTWLAFASFCLLSSAIYLVNDSVDAERDRAHPVKCHRPIAAGTLSVPAALTAAVLLAVVGLVGALPLGRPFLLVAIFYLVLQVAYSLGLKNLVILDLFTIAAGFVLRVVAGAFAVRAELSSWLIICTILLSLFLGLGKRRHEIATLAGGSQEHRKVLKHYSIYLLDQMIGVVTASTLVCYALYTVSTETVQRFHTRNLMYTIPFVLYGIFRYLYLIHQKGEGGNPENILVSDIPLVVDILLWAMSAAFVIYS